MHSSRKKVPRESGPDERAHTPQRRVGGRSARVRASVLESALTVLTELGPSGFSIAEVATRAGVHETSIYRRWGTRAALALDACLAFADATLTFADTGSLEEDLIELAVRVRNLLSSPKGRALLLVGVTLDEEFAAARADFWSTRLSGAHIIIARAIARGELPSDTHPTELLETIIAPLYFRALISGGALDRWPVPKAVRGAIRAAQSRI